MINIKRVVRNATIGLSLLVCGMTTVQPVFAAPANQGVTSTGQTAPADSADPPTLVKSHLLFNYVNYCLEHAGPNTPTLSFHNNGITTQDATEWKFFDDTASYPGVVVEPSDGLAKCNENGFIKQAYNLWGVNDPFAALCMSGFVRDDGSNCMNGTTSSQFVFDNKPRGSEFRKNINLTYYGNSGSNSNGSPAWNDTQRYYLYSQSFIIGCKARQDSSLNSLSDSEIKSNDHYFRMKVPSADGSSLQDVSYRADAGHGSNVNAGITDGGQIDSEECWTLVQNADKYAQGAADYIAATGDTSAIVANSGSNSASPDISCGGWSVMWNPLNWLSCAALQGFQKVANGLDDGIMSMLCVDETQIFGAQTSTCSTSSTDTSASAGYKAAWNAFRIISLGLLAVVALLMVLSQTSGLEVFDAYTIRKTLPRLLIAAIGIALSWNLMSFFVTLSNALGIGVRSLIYAPFNGAGVNQVVLTGGSAALGTLFGLGGMAVLGALGLLSFVLTGLLAILMAFFLLVLRNILVVVLIITAPIAIVAYILPNTEGIWKTWWGWFNKSLMVFPIITGFIAAGHVFAAIASEQAQTDQTGFGTSTVAALVAFIAYFAPYFLIPAAFRFAGGALGTLGGMVNDRSRGAFDRLKKFRGNKSQERLGFYGQKYGDRVMQRRAEAVRRLNESASGKGAVRGGAMRFAGRQIAGLGGIEHKMSAINARTGKQISDQIATGVDSDVRGLTVDRSMGWEKAANAGLAREYEGKRQWKSLGGAWIDESDVIEGQRKWGRDVAAQQAALSYEMRKATTDEEIAGVQSRYANLATKAWGQTDTQASGSWIGAAFENQNQHLEYKYSDWKSGQLKNNGSGFVSEIYEKRGSYGLSQMGAHTIEQLRDAHDQAAATGDVETQRKVQAIAETFMSRYGGGNAPIYDEDGKMVSPGGKSGGGIQTNAQGAGHVAEEVRKLAVHVGAYQPLSDTTDTRAPKDQGPSALPPDYPRQN